MALPHRNHPIRRLLSPRFAMTLTTAACVILMGGSAWAMQDSQPSKKPAQPTNRKAQPKRLPVRGAQPSLAGIGRRTPDLPLPAHNPDNEVDLGDGLIIVDMVEGDGRPITTGSLVIAEYTGWLHATGKMFDTSSKKGTPPFASAIPGKVVEGWNRGLMGLKVGGRRKIIIPAALGFGDKEVGAIPANSDLVFIVELLEVAPPFTDFADAGTAHPVEGDSSWADVVVGDGIEFTAGGFGSFHLSLWNHDGRYVGSTRRGTPSTVSADAKMFWTKFAHGMKRGGHRMVAFPDPSATPPKPDEDGTTAPREERVWHMLIRAEDISEPIFPTAHNPADEVDMGDGIRLIHLKVGDGEMVPEHYIPTIHYDSWVAEGEKLFDSTRRPGRTAISYSPGLYPESWEAALSEMRVGGKCKLIVPSEMAYGEKGSPNYGIGPNAALIYELELISFEQPLFIPTGGQAFEDLFGDPDAGKKDTGNHDDHDH